jgi:uncharacterized protein YdiU (UPF0061 family)
LSNLKFEIDNQFIHEFIADPVVDNYPRQVSFAYSFVNPKKTLKPQVIALSNDVAQLLGIPDEQVQCQQFAELVSGNTVVKDMQPFAMCYGGHQFGHWAGQLGDGRAINLAEVLTPQAGHQTMQLKGAGPTPYSRTADGLAVLRSSIREFLCSEAMFHLGIATTRALSLSLTGDSVVRDMFYDGHAKAEQGAVVCRVSPSFIRFGSFQLPTSRKDNALLTTLVNYSIKRDFPHLGTPDKQVYLQWFNEVCDRTCDLIVHWMRVGFVHGVMNTDNMSIIGETIDYGPYGWIDDFDLNWTPNTTDAQGKRYRFGAQAEIAQWNLFQLANAIFSLIEEAEPLQDALNNFAEQYHHKWQMMMASKLGLDGNIDNLDVALFLSLEDLLSSVETDMTIFYRLLATLPQQRDSWLNHLMPSYYVESALTAEYKESLFTWLDSYLLQREENTISTSERQKNMNAVNPKYVLRNYLAQQAIERAEQGDYLMIKELQQVFTQPYDEQPEFEHFAQKRPDWAKDKAGCSMLSCSS